MLRGILAGDGIPDAVAWLRAVRTFADAGGLSFEEAMSALAVPAALRDEVRRIHHHEGAVEIVRVRGVAAGGPRKWAESWDPADGYYWRRQRAFLMDRVGRSPAAVDATDDDSSKILSYLEDPRDVGPAAFDVRGLVIGNVQSGKTENFSALIAKAADVGYRVVIVLSGIHNGLRQQTQRRLERDLGLTAVEPGVGLPEAGRRWNNPTTADLYGDFQPGTADPSILQGNERVIFIVKKWHTVLERLLEFIRQGKPPRSLPVLVIDDEADQASIDTSSARAKSARLALGDLVAAGAPGVDLADEVDPSKTNRLIREIIGEFQRVSYVGYTATPFANVLIDPEVQHSAAGADLYPSDFILCLSPRPGYVGAARLFGRDAIDGEPEGPHPGLDVVRLVPPSDLPCVTPVGSVKAADFVPSVPGSLKEALTDWALASGAMLARAGRDRPSSMLIHIHQGKDIQNALIPQVEELVSAFRKDWRYDESGAFRAKVEQRWETEFRPITRRIDPARDLSFDVVSAEISRMFKSPVPVLGLNSDTDDELDYTRESTLKAVVIGGNKLSRGMTVEGLVTSYYVRETPYMDTLLQMARWFGYREDYVDLTRLYTTETLASWFRDVALVEEELRAQVLQAELDEVPPREVGYRLRSHPAMMVTAQNKMGAGRVEKLSLAGKMIQTTRFRLDERDWLLENLRAAQRFVSALGEPQSDGRGHYLWQGVSAEAICRFMGEYQTVQDRTSFDAATVSRYVTAQAAHGELVSWQVAISTRALEDPGLGLVDLCVAGFGSIPAMSRTRLKLDRTSIGVLTSPARTSGPMHRGDDEIGLTEDQIQAARQAVADRRFERLRDALLAQRSPSEGLLVLFPIGARSQPRPDAGDRVALFADPEQDGCDVVGVAIGFPPSSSAASIDYVSAG